MKRDKIDKRQQGFYLFLMISAYVSTAGFGIFYYFAGVPVIAFICGGAFLLFVMYGALSFVTPGLVILFRLSIATATAAFYAQVYFTGGLQSAAMPVFIIPPLLAFFYRPIKDRYYFMVLSGLSIVSMWPLTVHGYASNLLPGSYQNFNAFLCTFFVFAIVIIYAFLYRGALAKKNKKLSESMRDLQTTSQKLIEAEKMASLGIMSAGVAHEINNPLNFIKGGIEGLAKQQKDSADAQPFIKAIREGVERATSIVSSLGHFSRGTSAMDETCDLHDILDNCLIMLQHKLKYKAKIIKQYAPSSVKLLGNEGKLHQAFLNILANAEQAIEESGTITIESKVNKENIRLTISDDGVGISQENLLKISDPFFTTKPVGQGTGLGLAITYKIIREHNGKISVTSTPSSGTRFTILFKSTKK